MSWEIAVASIQRLFAEVKPGERAPQISLLNFAPVALAGK
jgi:hypothetical protein